MNMEEKIALREWALRIVYYMNAVKTMEIFSNEVNVVFTPNIHVYTGIEKLAEVLACELSENEKYIRMNFQGVDFVQVKREKVDRCQNS